MTSFDPAYIVILIILILAVLGGYYLYRNALQSETDNLQIEDEEKGND